MDIKFMHILVYYFEKDSRYMATLECIQVKNIILQSSCNGLWAAIAEGGGTIRLQSPFGPSVMAYG